VIVAGVDPVSVSIAGYAAVVATVGIGFQVFSWRRNTQTRLKVKLSRRELMTPGDPAPPEKVALIEMVNYSNHEVAITHVGFKPQRKGDPHLFIPRPLPETEPVPIVIPPRRSKNVWVTIDMLEEKANLTKPLQARIGTDDDHDFDSKPAVLEPPGDQT
jgi:hypothetical protein